MFKSVGQPFKNIFKYDFPMVFPATGAAFLPERLPKSARNRVLMLSRKRAELTEHFAGIPAQIRWPELEQ